MKTKPDFKQHVQTDNPRGGCGLGCMSIGCLGVIGLVITLMLAGYYSLFHSSLPLRMIEAAIEEDGEVEIEGLTGSLSDGFSADEIRFKTIDDRWSNLTDVKFKYEGGMSIFGSDRLIIEELSVGGGTIYADWDPEKNELDFDPNFNDELDKEWEEFDKEFAEENGVSSSLREMSIKLVSVKKLKIVNPTTELEITIDEVTFEGFQWKENDLQSLGTLLVRSSQLDIETVPSIEFADMKQARRLEGTLRSETDRRLKSDVRFVFDFGVSDNLDVSLKGELFDGQFQFEQLPEQESLTYVDFSPADFIELAEFGILPSHVKMKLSFDENLDQESVDVNQDGSFNLGKTRFGNLQIQKQPDGPSQVVATGEVNGNVVTATLKIDGFSPWWRMGLASAGFESAAEVWAQTVYGSPFAKLSDEQRSAVKASLPKPEPEKEVEVEAEEKPEIQAEQNGTAEQDSEVPPVEAEISK